MRPARNTRKPRRLRDYDGDDASPRAEAKKSRRARLSAVASPSEDETAVDALWSRLWSPLPSDDELLAEQLMLPSSTSNPPPPPPILVNRRNDSEDSSSPTASPIPLPAAEAPASAPTGMIAMANGLYNFLPCPSQAPSAAPEPFRPGMPAPLPPSIRHMPPVAYAYPIPATSLFSAPSAAAAHPETAAAPALADVAGPQPSHHCQHPPPLQQPPRPVQALTVRPPPPPNAPALVLAPTSIPVSSSSATAGAAKPSSSDWHVLQQPTHVHPGATNCTTWISLSPFASDSAGGGALGGGSGRNLIERKEWTLAEDEQIRASVKKHGFKWRLVAADVPGRSDDAVRNRWHRIKPESEAAHAASAGSSSSGETTEASDKGSDVSDTSGGGGDGGGDGGNGGSGKGSEGNKQPRNSTKASRESGVGTSSGHASGKSASAIDRVSWSRAEDELIMRSVAELGHRWSTINERLPARTEHAIRNRYSRLLSLASRGKTIALSSTAKGMPIGISLVPGH